MCTYTRRGMNRREQKLLSITGIQFLACVLDADKVDLWPSNIGLRTSLNNPKVFLTCEDTKTMASKHEGALGSDYIFELHVLSSLKSRHAEDWDSNAIVTLCYGIVNRG